MADFRTVTLESLALPTKGSFAMGPFGSDIKTDNFVDFGVPIIKGQNLGDCRLLEDSFDYLTEEKADELSNSIAKSGDIVFTHRGTLGQVAMIPRQSRYPRYIVSQSQMKVSLDEEQALPEYVTYYFQSSVGQHMLMSYASQTGVPAIGQPLTSLRKMLVTLPSINEQRAIASVLGALDDKIESNRRLAATIDCLLRAELENAILNDDNPREVQLGEIALRVGEASDPRNLHEHVPYIGLEHMPRGNMFLDEWGTSEGLGSGKSVFKEGNVLFGRLRPYFKKAGVAPIDGICSTDVLVLKPAFNESAAMLLALAASEEFIGYASAAATGTKMPRVSWDYLSDWKTVLPSEAATSRFDNDMLPLVAKAIASVHERVALAKLRDALLPELLSGRLRVKDAKTMMENV